MSPLVLLGAIATVLSTVTLLPHLVHALRAGRPGGSTTGWTLGFLSSLAWCVYGLGIGDLVVAAPGVITIPVGAALAVWCFVAGRRHAGAVVQVLAVPEVLTSPVAAPAAAAVVTAAATAAAAAVSADPADTLELSLIA